MYIQTGFDEKHVQLIIEKCPTAYAALGTFYGQAVSQQLQSKEAREIVQAYMDNIGVDPQLAMLQAHFRMLYDFFDSYSIHVYIDQTYLEYPNQLSPKVMDSQVLMTIFPETLEIGAHTGRSREELSAFYAAFQHLELRLTKPEFFYWNKHTTKKEDHAGRDISQVREEPAKNTEHPESDV